MKVKPNHPTRLAFLNALVPHSSFAGRSFLAFVVITALAFSPIAFSSTAIRSTGSEAKNAALTDLEKSIGGRIGVFAIDVESGRTFSYRAGETFMMCSAFKVLLAAQILALYDQKQESLTRSVAIVKSDLAEYSPVTSKHVSKTGMTVSELAKAMIQYSDNTAANLLLRTQGGPAGLTRFLRSIGDPVTHLDRIEPQLNTPVPGQDLDSTTPRSMVNSLKSLLFSKKLSSASKTQLQEWLLGNTTGEHRLKAGLPLDWKIGDKTGSGDAGATNDVGVLYPPSGSPLVIAVFASGSLKSRAEIEVVFPKITPLVIRALTAKP